MVLGGRDNQFQRQFVQIVNDFVPQARADAVLELGTDSGEYGGG
jgi:hypothetical protein